MAFSNRIEAGRLLAESPSKHKGKKNAIVLAIPRGGVETGYGLAKALGCGLGIVVSKKLSYPGQEELAIGAVCNGNVSLDKQLIEAHSISRAYIDDEVGKLKASMGRRYAELAGKGRFPSLKGKTVILGDDGMATGHTFLAALDFIRGKSPARIVAAIPVGPQESMALLGKKADEVVALETPRHFMAVGEFYRSFEQLSDKGVRKYLKLANEKLKNKKAGLD